MPRLGDEVERLGGALDGDGLAEALALAMPVDERPEARLLTAAKASFVDAIDLLWLSATSSGGGELRRSDMDALADLSASAVGYARDTPRPKWLDDVSDDEQFVIRLEEAIASYTPSDDFMAGERDHGEEGAWEALGDGATWGRLHAGVQRIRSAAVNRVARPSGEKLRSKVVPKLTDFLGDVLVYLSERPQPIDGVRQAGGAIADGIAGVLRDAHATRLNEDPLVVVAHSMGGNIVHDVLTRHPDTQGINVDVLVTVGSQVGFFEELSLFGQHPGVPGLVARRLPRPSAVRRWINIFDYNDPLSFRLAPIMEEVEDCEYRTGSFWAHGAYFLQPTFHALLAERVRRRP